MRLRRRGEDVSCCLQTYLRLSLIRLRKDKGSFVNRNQVSCNVPFWTRIHEEERLVVNGVTRALWISCKISRENRVTVSRLIDDRWYEPIELETVQLTIDFNQFNRGSLDCPLISRNFNKFNRRPFNWRLVRASEIKDYKYSLSGYEYFKQDQLQPWVIEWIDFVFAQNSRQLNNF